MESLCIYSHAIGAVYIYVKVADGEQWNQTQVIEAADGAMGDFFGSSISLYGVSLAVGSPHHSTSGTNFSGTPSLRIILLICILPESGLVNSHRYRRSVPIFQP